MKFLVASICFAAAWAESVQYTEAQLGQEITNLPGVPAEAKFRMFSGYISVDAENSRKLFYWFVEAESNPSSSPVTLWSNGGPGCSGLGGFMTENGPFRPKPNGTALFTNPYSWNKLTNMVYIEQPAGVGFSTAPSDFTGYNDAQAATDNANFVTGFFKLFPQYATNPFYISSESYGGHYMPTLALQIVKNKNVPNFKGFLVGNPLTYMPYRDYGMYGTYYGHQLIDQPVWDKYLAAGCKEDDSSATCGDLMSQMDAYTAGLDPYALDFPVCTTDAATGRHERFAMQKNVLRSRNQKLGGYWPDEYDACSGDNAAMYLNRKDVQAAINVEGSVVWADCSDSVGNLYNLTDVVAPMMPVYKELIDGGYGLHILVYSGDDDSVCATLGSQQWIWNLGYDNTKPWAPWNMEGQVAGYYAAFKGFAFATIHGAGHMVPATRPAQMLELLKQFFAGAV